MTAPAAEAPQAGARGRLKWTIIALLALQAGAMGLKAWHDRQNADETLIMGMQRDAGMIASQINGRADTSMAALDLSLETRTSRQTATGAAPGIDAFLSLSDAAQAPAGSRFKVAAETAARLVERDQRVGLSANNDFIVVSKNQNGTSYLGIAKAGAWLPRPPRGTRLTVVDQKRYGIGAPEIGQIANRAKSGFTANGMLNRVATACAPLRGSSAAICKSRSTPLVSLNDIIGFLIYALLLAAPMLAIIGLMRRVAIEVEDEIIDEVRDDEADRIMNVVMRGAQAGYWEWKTEEDGLYMSDGAANLLGTMGDGVFSIDQLIEFVHPRHREHVEDKLRKSVGLGWIQLTFPTASTPLKWIEMRGSLTPGDEETPSLYGGIAMDITDRKTSEDRVKAAERRLRNAIEGFTGPFALWDHRKRLLYWNRAFALDFGLQDTLRPGMSHDTVEIAKAGAIRSEKTSYEDNQTKILSLNAGRHLKLVERNTADGGMISIGVDVSENVRNEEELKRQKTKMKKAVIELERSEGRADALSRKYSEEKAKAEHAANTKSAFLANMSHELRTPLNAINGFSEILANQLYGPLGDDRYQGYAADILTSGQHLLDMINDILDMAKIEAGKMTINPQPIDPVDPVDAAVRMIRRKAADKDINLVLSAADGLPDIEADHRAIRQMVLNLISNAIKFTDAGGTITVEVKGYGDDIRVAVTDTGIGIPEEDLPRLAQPFEQVNETRDRNYEGTGLGLALTKSFAEMHGGRMTIASEVGVGTTVSFYLPMEADNVEIARDVA